MLQTFQLQMFILIYLMYIECSTITKGPYDTVKIKKVFSKLTVLVIQFALHQCTIIGQQYIEKKTSHCPNNNETSFLLCPYRTNIANALTYSNPLAH